MPEPNKSSDGEHIEELLSQLKGIFGNLSEAEQEEAKKKITPPAMPASGSPPSQIENPAPAAQVTHPPPLSELPTSPASAEELVPFTPIPELSEPQAPAELAHMPGSDPYTPNEVPVPEGASLVPTAIFYPAGRITEAKIVAGKVEKITPKFTKVSVVVNVQSLAPYDLKADLKSVVLPLITSPIKAVFILTEKSLDDVRRKALVSDLEPRGIYFQDIPVLQIEKKALYMDMLLGMVFFFDSQKKPGEEPSAGGTST